MLDIKFIRDNKKLVEKNNKTRKVSVDLEKLLSLDSQRREMQMETDGLANERNKISKSKPTEAEIVEMRKLGDRLKELMEKQRQLEEKISQILQKIPNINHPSTPIGLDESGNKVLRTVGKIPRFSFNAKEHWQLGKERDLIDNERAAKVAGSRFTYLKGKLAFLQFVLIQYTLSILTNESILKEIIKKAGLKLKAAPFIPVVPPVMIKPEIFQKMARLEPKEERYYLSQDDLFLIGSAEHTLGPLHMDEILEEENLPLRYVGVSTCFRREAGSYGKDTKGIIRVHQFDKIEMESFTVPEESIAEQDFLVAIEEYLVSSLNLPYRVVQICSGDISAPDARQIDIEVWLPGQGKYRETHTSDLMTDYQARRLKIRVKRRNGKLEPAHMNDATAFAVGRALIAVMENYQQEDGRIAVPEILRPLAGFDFI